MVYRYTLHRESPGGCYLGATLEQYHGLMLYEVTLWLRYGYVLAAATLLRQPEEKPCYGCLGSQESINPSEVPTAPSVFF